MCLQINYFYKDAMNDGGVPDDVNSMFFAIPEESRGKIYTRNGPRFCNRDKYIERYLNLLDMITTVVKSRHRLRVSANIAVGGLIIENAFIFIVFLILRIPYIIMPNSQLNQWSLKNKVFFESPIVDQSSYNKVIDKMWLYAKIRLIKTKVSIYGKHVYAYILMPFFLHFSKGVLVLSEFERKQISALANIKSNKFLVSPLGFTPDKERKVSDRYMSHYKGFLNIVYWGRIDYRNKGIDRIIPALFKERDSIEKMRVKFHFLGPGYNNGREELKAALSGKEKMDFVVLPSEDEIKDIDLGGLVYADAVIFPTRWDGYPRALRESTYYGVPVIVSEESNYWDMVDNGTQVYPMKHINDTSTFPEELLEILERLNVDKSAKERRVNNSFSWEKRAGQMTGALISFFKKNC
jgi:hypothetical protein